LSLQDLPAGGGSRFPPPPLFLHDWGLKKFDEAERLARQMADESPGSPYRYDNLALVQTEARRFDAALATLAEARKAVVGTDV
jgi:hypothetical protein